MGDESDPGSRDSDKNAYVPLKERRKQQVSVYFAISYGENVNKLMYILATASLRWR